MQPDLDALHVEIRACRQCVRAGFIPEATPIGTAEYDFEAPAAREAYRGPLGSGRVMLIGQAPGQLEAVAREHFVGRAGRVLFRWLEGIGISESDVRRYVYVTAVTKCYPGKSSVRGGGDRRPTPEEARLCRPFLDRQLEIVSPKLILPVGKMAIDLYLPRRPLDDLVGSVFELDGRELLPLPHPSGMSRWLNAAANQGKLVRALALLRERLSL